MRGPSETSMWACGRGRHSSSSIDLASRQCACGLAHAWRALLALRTAGLATAAARWRRWRAWLWAWGRARPTTAPRCSRLRCKTSTWCGGGARAPCLWPGPACLPACIGPTPPPRPTLTHHPTHPPQAYAKYVKDQAGAPPHCPEVTIEQPELSVRIPPLPPLVNAPEEPAPGRGGGQGDASVGVSLKPGSGKAGGGWGTSNIARPSTMAGECAGGVLWGRHACSAPLHHPQQCYPTPHACSGCHCSAHGGAARAQRPVLWLAGRGGGGGGRAAGGARGR